jgi:hypothetical protein
MMDICHEHNASRDLGRAKPYGIRVRMRATDSLARILGSDWERYHWYASEEERDAALKDMASEHLYSRRGDEPTLIYTPIQRSAENRPDV